jgi:hypothetical protein
MDGYRRAEDEGRGDHELVGHWINCRQNMASVSEEGTRGESTMGHVQSGDTSDVQCMCSRRAIIDAGPAHSVY